MQGVFATIHKNDSIIHSAVLSKFKIICKVSRAYKIYSWGMLLLPLLHRWSLEG